MLSCTPPPGDFKQVTVPGQPQPYSCKSADYPVYLSFSLDGAISTLIYNKVGLLQRYMTSNAGIEFKVFNFRQGTF